MQPETTDSQGKGQVLPLHVQDSVPTTAPTTTDLHSQSTLRSAEDTSNDTSRAATLVSGVIQTAKTAVDDAMSWAENKASAVHLDKENIGPYNSPATCMPSDLDAIANGILPAMPNKSQRDESLEKQGKEA